MDRKTYGGLIKLILALSLVQIAIFMTSMSVFAQEKKNATDIDVQEFISEIQNKYNFEIPESARMAVEKGIDALMNLGVTQEELADIVDDIYSDISDELGSNLEAAIEEAIEESVQDVIEDIKENVKESVKEKITESIKPKSSDTTGESFADGIRKALQGVGRFFRKITLGSGFFPFF